MAKHRKSKSRLPGVIAIAATAAAVMISGTFYAVAKTTQEPVHLAPVHLTAPVLASPSEPAAPAPAAAVYVVRAGDTLSGVAKRLCGSSAKWQQLASANHISGNSLRIGERITVEC
jgi:nucleoid-associated protein YgaU